MYFLEIKEEKPYGNALKKANSQQLDLEGGFFSSGLRVLTKPFFKEPPLKCLFVLFPEAII